MNYLRMRAQPSCPKFLVMRFTLEISIYKIKRILIIFKDFKAFSAYLSYVYSCAIFLGPTITTQLPKFWQNINLCVK